MSTLREIGDAVEGERLVCLCRKVAGPYLVAGTSGHRAQRVVMHGLPARTWIEKPIQRGHQ